MLSFGPLTTEELETHLRTTGKRPEGEIHMLARLARGSIGRALDIDLDQYRKIRTAMLELVDTMGVSRDAVRLMRAAEYLGKKLERDEFEEHIDVLLVLLSDVFHLKLGEPADSLANSDMAERLTRISESVTFDEITGWVDSIELMLQGLIRNVNRELAMDAVLIQV
jgi:DNA polymerase-3 subunit delta'